MEKKALDLEMFGVDLEKLGGPEACKARRASSKAVCDQFVAVDKRRIGKKIGALTPAELALLEDSLRKVLGL